MEKNQQKILLENQLIRGGSARSVRLWWAASRVEITLPDKNLKKNYNRKPNNRVQKSFFYTLIIIQFPDFLQHVKILRYYRSK